MRLIDLDQTIFVPIVDETRGGVEYEMEMTVGEFFEKFFDGCCPETVDAIPVEWMVEQRDKLSEAWDEEWHEINGLIEQWREEQEAK